ncbi:hypothetical protein [Cellulomonas sp. URHD0024]|uniref:hypothetical protein n=1 Tax=Cellulomonas sp. URHD0024 TaxID=1302620 RepID=UPI0003F57803|nr:hypothetical protein [Cellulomonas sp. URHD0024]
MTQHLPHQRTTARRRVVIGLDIGAVTAQVRVVDQASGSIVLDHMSASASWSATPLSYATAWIVDTVRRALDDCADVELVAVGVGATGCEVRALSDALGTTVCAALRVPTVVVNDAELLIPAAGLERGVGVLVGCSAIAVATGPGALTGASSWAFSDVGSASSLVREAVANVLARAARDETPDPLRIRLMDSMQLRSVDELAQVLHWNARALPWGSHAPAVFEAADEGSRDAHALVTANAQAVATLVVQLAQRGVDVLHAVVGGDVAPEVPRLFAGIRRSILDELPDADVRMLDAPAVEGAVRLAQRTVVDGRP